MPTAVGDSISTVINFIIKFWWIWVLLFLAFIFLKYYLSKRTEKFEEFKPQPLQKTTRNGLKKYFSVQGIDMKKGKLYKGFHKIADINRYFNAKGKIDIFIFDERNKKISVSDEKMDYDLLFLETHNPFFLFKLLSLKRNYFILRYKNANGEKVLRFNTTEETVIVEPDSHIFPYADIYTNCYAGIETVNDISMTRLNEQLQMHLENNPDKYVHLEMQQAKLERKVRIAGESERLKFKDKEEAGDTSLLS